MIFEAPVKTVIFDMDGVILDTERICLETWKLAGREYNLDNAEQVYRICVGMNKADTLSVLENRYGCGFNAENFMRRTSELFCVIEKEHGIPLMPGVLEALNYLKPKYRLALASSTRKAVVSKQLTDAGVIEYFEALTCGDEVAHSKPDPEIYIRACKSVDTPVENCVAVEDSPNGIKSAYSAGLKTIMVPDMIQPPEELMPLIWKILPSLKEIKSVL